MNKNLPLKYLIWIEARKKFHLSHPQIQMARELGMNPKKFGKLSNHEQESWKLPLGEYIEELYLKYFKRRSPMNVYSLEELAKEEKKKHEAGKERRLSEKAEETGTDL
ncbi:MAG: hypothetical protein HY200_09415 [Nitrospirae bacterium]|nr:hypothetical protein [Bacteroidota bacterium]MBI3595162.1 hypothetical protein [Nitrospirota bacterium]